MIDRGDVVHIHWWNHPQLNALLAGSDLPDMQTVLWSHVNGHYAPQSFFPQLVEYPNVFVVAAPFSLDSPVLKAVAGGDWLRLYSDSIRNLQKITSVGQKGRK